jgi:hypothetical protein
MEAWEIGQEVSQAIRNAVGEDLADIRFAIEDRPPSDAAGLGFGVGVGVVLLALILWRVW